MCQLEMTSLEERNMKSTNIADNNDWKAINMSSVKRYYLVDPWGENWEIQECIPLDAYSLLFVILGGLCPGGPLSREVYVQEGLCPRAICPVISVRESPLYRRNMRIETETPWKEHGTRQADRKWHLTETLACEQNNWQTGLKALPSLNFICGR